MGDQQDNENHSAAMERFGNKARTLIEALPYMQEYAEQVVLVKYGGHAMGDPEASMDFARDIVMLHRSGIKPVVVHGGGPQIGRMLSKLGIESQFAGGLRITDKETVKVVEMVLAGAINKEIVSYIQKVGGRAVGLSGKDAGMVLAQKIHHRMVETDSNVERIVDLGFVGEPIKVRPKILEVLQDQAFIPVIAPLAANAEGATLNINADTFAGAIAGALNAKRMILMTDVDGVLDTNGKLIKQLKSADVKRLISEGTIYGGMIPKVETCLNALNAGVEGVVILNGQVQHSVIIELLTDRGSGTLFVR